MRPENPPPPEFVVSYYRNPPISGNVINGLGEESKRCATPVFHSTGRGGGRQALAWEAMDTYFNLVASPACLWQVIRTLWQRRGYGCREMVCRFRQMYSILQQYSRLWYMY